MEYYEAIRFNFWNTSGFSGCFEFFDFNRFLTESCSPNVLMMHIFVFRRSKRIRKATIFEKKNSSSCQKWHFGGHFVFFDPVFLPEVNDVGNWAAIQNLVMSNTNYIPNFKKIRIKLWPWQFARVFVKMAAVTLTIMLMSWNTNALH